jgi:hypothetical protein
MCPPRMLTTVALFSLVARSFQGGGLITSPRMGGATNVHRKFDPSVPIPEKYVSCPSRRRPAISPPPKPISTKAKQVSRHPAIQPSSHHQVFFGFWCFDPLFGLLTVYNLRTETGFSVPFPFPALFDSFSSRRWKLASPDLAHVSPPVPPRTRFGAFSSPASDRRSLGNIFLSTTSKTE